MSEHSLEHAAAIVAAATAAGAHDPSDLLALIPAADLTNPADAVAKLKGSKPHFFRKSVPEMTGPEYAAARQAAIRSAEAERRTDERARESAHLAKKYSK